MFSSSRRRGSKEEEVDQRLTKRERRRSEGVKK